MALWVTVAITVVMPPAHTLAGVFYDDGIYLALAKSLAEGEGYRLPYLPGAPAAVHYPFVYPAFLAVLWKLWPDFPSNLLLLRGINALLVGAASGLLTAYAIPRLPVRGWITALTVAAVTIAIPLAAVATVVFAEPLFMVLAAAACWGADAASDRRRDVRSPRAVYLFTVVSGVLAGLSALTRSIGIAVIAGVALSFVLAHQRRLAVLALAPAVLVLVPWMLWVRAHAGAVDPLTASNYGTYGDFLRQGGLSWLSPGSLLDIARPLGGVSLPRVPAALRVPLGLLAALVLLLGMARLTVHMPALGWTTWGYFGVVLLWPYGPDRFIWCALPWLALAFVAGVHRLATWRPARWRRVLAGVAAASVAVGYSWYQLRIGYAGVTREQQAISATVTDLMPWLRANTDSSAVIATEAEAMVWLYTGRRAIPSYLWRVRGRAAESFGPDSLHAFLERNRATHLVVAGPASDAAPTVDQLMGTRRGYLELINIFPNNMLAFRIRRGA